MPTLKPVRIKDRILNFAFTGQGAQYVTYVNLTEKYTVS